MVRLNYLEPFDVYKTKPPVIMPENERNRRKGIAYMVIAPSVEAELAWVADNQVYRFRNLYKYFLDKRWDYSLYRVGRKVVKLNQDGDISALLDKYHHGNLKNVDEITSYAPTSSARPMKNMNVLVESCYTIERILANPKDKRLAAVRAEEIMASIHKTYDSIEQYMGNYQVIVLFPMELWIQQSEFSNPASLLKRTNKSVGAQLLRLFTDEKNLFPNLYLLYSQCVLPLSDHAPTEDKLNVLIAGEVTRIATKIRTLRTPEKADGLPGSEEPDEKDAESESKLKAAEEKTVKSVATEKVLDSAKIDPDTVSTAQKEKIEKAVTKAIVKAPPKSAKTSSPSSSAPVKERDPKPISPRPQQQVAPVPTTKPGVTVPVAQKNLPKQPEKTIDTDLIRTEEDIDFDQLHIDEPEEVDAILAARTSGQSVQSYKRNEMLKEKYKELKMGDIPLTDLIKEEESYQIPEVRPQTHTVVEGLKEIKPAEFERAYNENLMQSDTINILLHFGHVHPAMFLNKDIKVEDVSTPTDRLLKYTVEFEDEGRKRHKFSFLMPKMYKDRYLYLSDQSMNIVHQKLPYPVTKVSPEKCQAITNYRKIFTERYGANFSPRITKIQKFFIGPNCPKFAKVEKGNCTELNKAYLTTIEYDEIGSSIVKLMMGKGQEYTKIFFAVDDARAEVSAFSMPLPEGETEPLLPLGKLVVQRGVYECYYISSTTNKVYNTPGACLGELSDFIIERAAKYDPKVRDEFSEISAGSKFVYSRSHVMDENIPTILMLAAADPDHLAGVLDKAQIKFDFVTKRPTVNKDVQGVVPFSDGWLVFDRYPYENSLLMNGLSTIPTREISYYDMLSRDTYVDLFGDMFGRRNLVDSLENFYYVFVDPITADVLTKLGMPTDFTRLLLYCNDILADNTYQIDSDYNNTRLRSNEIINAHLYLELADAWGRYRTGRADTFSIPENCVIKYLLTSNIVDPHSELNMTLETENDRQVKLKGPSGMNEDHSFTLEKRAYHPTMRGVIGMNSTPSGEVGINRHLTINANITDARGFINIEKPEYDGTELTTPGEMLQAFGPESSDIERVAMSISQSKHVVPVESESSCPVSYDMERTMPYLSNDYAYSAKKDGVVKAIENEIMIIEYEDGTFDDIDLSERPAKNTDGGFYIMNQLTTTLKVGDKVSKNQLVAIDKKYINQNDMFGDPLASVGTLARIAVETNGGVYEDACYITDGLAHRMATKITRQKRVILSKYANIKYMAKIGQHVEANDPILTFDDTADEFTSQMLAAIADEAGDDDDTVIATSAPVISKFTGTIKDIRIYYTTPVEEMTPSMKKIVGDYVKDTTKREKTLDKYVGRYNSNTIVKTSQQLQPDSTGKVKGVEMPDGIMIDFYIEYLDIMAAGDKLSYFSALKGIVSDVIPEEYAPYTASNPERKIDACLSCIGVYKRMTLDIVKVGTMNKIVIEKKRKLKEQFGQRVKAELKK